MTSKPQHPDVAEPMDALRRVVTACEVGQVELDPEDLYAISRLGAEMAGEVRGQVGSLDAEARFALLGRLQALCDGFGGYDFSGVFGALTSDDDASVRASAVGGLGLCETAYATSLLTQIAQLGEEEDDVRQQAVTALAEVALRLELGWAASEEADGVVETLRALAQDPQEAEALRAAAISGVGVVSEPWVASLIESAYDSDTAALHLAAVEAMGRSADVNWLPVLENALVAEDEDERLAAVQAIGEIGSEEGTPLLMELFDDPTSSEELLESIVAALGEIASEEALEELTQLQTHPDPAIRERAQAAISSATWLDEINPSWSEG